MFTTYSASAGSGKTTNLVADFITICFRSDSRLIGKEKKDLHLDIFQKILAITFTNNAASEMKDRIVRTLTTFAFESPEHIDGSALAIYRMVVQKLFGDNPPEETLLAEFIQFESKELLRRILYDYARFTISTIDSFFQRVIRSSALTLNLNINYTVQINMDEFYIQAIDQLLNELSADTELAKRILNLLENSMEDSGNLNIDKELKNGLEILYGNAEKNHEFLQILQHSNAETLLQKNKKVREWLKQIPSDLSKAIKNDADEGNRWISKLANINFHFPTFAKWFDNILEDPIGNYKESVESFKNSKGSYFKKTKFTDEEAALIDEVMPHIETCFGHIQQTLQPYIQPILDTRIRTQHADKLALLADLQSKMEEIKQQNNFFILGESNTLIYETIQNQGFESLFDRIRFDNFFIDEFQDTSKMQWEDLKPLIINNALANNKELSLFGDVKQAIYRFRNGDADLFYNLIDLSRLQQDPDLRIVQKDNYQQIVLQNNYRSLQSVVAFNNEFFNYYSKEKNLEKYYTEGLIQNIVKKEPGFVQLFIGCKNDTKENKRSCFKEDQSFLEPICKDKDISSTDMQVLLAVKDALKRGYEEGDIAILYSGNDNCARMANLLLKQKWNVITNKSLTLDSSAEVNLIIYTLQYLLHPLNLLAQGTIIYYMSKLAGKEKPLEEYLLTLKQKKNFHQIMEAQFGQTIPRDEWMAQPFLILIKEIIRFYHLDKQENPFVVSFQNFVIKYLNNKRGDITEFLTWWKQVNDSKHKPSVALPGKQNAITISTIHKSKGLEYPVVILPYSSTNNRIRPIWTKISDDDVAYIELSDKNSRGSSYEKLYQEEIVNKGMEDLNLLYVAHTRARDVLYVVTQKHKEEGSDYGDYLHTFVTLNENSTHLNGGLVFVKDVEDERYHYAGDRNWKKVGKENNTAIQEESIAPKFHTSDFDLGKVKIMVSESVQGDDPRLEGTFIHDFLAKTTIFPTNNEEIEELIREVDENRKNRLRLAFQKIMNEDSLQPYFAPEAKVRNEITIIDQDGEQHRPDRIVFMEDRVMVIDYKTGQPHPQYEQQIETYCTLLREMGYQNVEGKILYV